MSEQPASNRPEPADSLTGPGEALPAAGAALLKERRRQGLSLGDISRQLKLSVRQVEALERDDYSAYKGPVFIHGFIRNYAKLLGLDPEPLIRATDTMLKPAQSAVPEPREQDSPRPAKPPKAMPRLWPVVLTVLIIGAVLALYLGGRPAPDVANGDSAVALPDNRAALPANPENATPGGAEPKSRAEQNEPAGRAAAKPHAKPEANAEPKTDAINRGTPLERAAAGPVPASGRATVRMFFDQESWVEIKDRSGNTIFGQLNPAGSRRSVSGELPLSVVVGNAAGVRLFQGEKSIDLGPHTRVDVARLTLE